MTAELAAVGRLVLRTSLKGSLATLDRATGAPYVSMVSVARPSSIFRSKSTPSAIL